MRKRVIIGVLAIIGAGFLLFVLSQPKKGSSEWHQREFRAAYDRLTGRTWLDRVRGFCRRVLGLRIPPMGKYERNSLCDRLDRHEKALIDLGFLKKRTLSFHSYMTHFPGGGMVRPRYESLSIYARADYGAKVGEIIVIGAPEDMPKWEELLRKMERLNQGRRKTKLGMNIPSICGRALS